LVNHISKDDVFFCEAGDGAQGSLEWNPRSEEGKACTGRRGYTSDIKS